MKQIVIITGTGRSGTTLLVQMLSMLGLDTGYQDFTPEQLEESVSTHESRGGLEVDASSLSGFPAICKSPQFWNRIPQTLQSYDIVKVFVPIRELDIASKSRVKHGYNAGGMWGGADDLETQRHHNAKVIYQISLDCALHEIPLKYIAFNKLVVDKDYAFEVCQDIALASKSEPIDRGKFGIVFDKTVDHSKITTK
jgi:hypothetical protein